MWTPRRIVLALFGFLACVAGYVAYARGLGTYDGLPPLPQEFWPKDGPGTQQPPPVFTSTMDKKFQEAFGANCPEIGYPIKTELKGKHVLVAARDFKIVKSGERVGWVELLSLSLAAFGQKHGADGIPEINTLYCDVAYLKFDKPIRAVSDLSEAHIVFAELQANPESQLADPRKGRVTARNNRRTLDRNDDIEMVTPGPVYYEAEPRPGQPHIYTSNQTTVHVTDHLNTGLPEPNYLEPRDPTAAGEGLRIYLVEEDDKKKKNPPKKGEPRIPVPHKDEPGVSGVRLVELDHAVEMNLWTDADASFVAPGGGEKDPKKEAKKAEAKKDPKEVEKRLLQVRTNGPFRYDLTKELAHFEKPAVSRPGLIEHVVVTRQGRTVGQDMLDCDVLDVQFQRKKPPEPTKDAPPKPPPPPAKKTEGAGDGDLEIKSIHATGETVVMTSDSENLHATGADLTHDAVEHVTVLKGTPAQPVQAVKDGNLMRGSEVHLFGDGKEITQGHVLGAGSVGLGELDPKTGDFFKQATWADRLVFTREPGEKGKPPIDVLVFLGKDKTPAKFRDTSGGEVQEIEAMVLKVRLKPADSSDSKKDPKGTAKKPADKKKAEAKKDAPKADPAGGAKPTRLEATGDVRSTSPDLIIKHADYLDVMFRDVDELIKPPPPDPKAKDPKAAPKGSVTPKGEVPAPRVVDPKAEPRPAPKGDVPAVVEAKKDEPPADEKKPIVVSARTIKAWVNRDPKGHNELDHVLAKGDVQAHQDPANKDELGTDIAGTEVAMQAYKEGNRLTVIGIPGETQAKHQWGVVRFDKLTMFGFDIVIDQRDNTSNIKGKGSMEIISNTDMEGKKVEKPTTMTIYWDHKMDFLGAEKLIYFHGAVQGYQEDSRLKCEWMQVLLDRPVLLNQDLKQKAAPKKRKPGEKKDNDSPNIDTVMCFHAPKDEDVPKPKHAQPVTVIQEEKENGKTIRFQSVRAPEVVTVNTPLEDGRSRKDMTATSSATLPGEVRIWQAGQKDALADKPAKKDEPPKKNAPPKKKGQLEPDQEMQLTVIQFGGKMVANDFRKRAKFYDHIRTIHLPADSPTVPVDLREGDIPDGAVYLECRDTLEVFATEQMEKNPKTGKPEPVQYQEMIAIGNVKVRKQGEYYGDADRVTYSELKGTMTFHGTAKNPARLYRIQGQGIPPKESAGEKIIYYLKTKTPEVINATRIGQ
jgi:lipopolysaccharide export system protein LptA